LEELRAIFLILPERRLNLFLIRAFGIPSPLPDAQTTTHEVTTADAQTTTVDMPTTDAQTTTQEVTTTDAQTTRYGRHDNLVI
jgi:hypothetical protein